MTTTTASNADIAIGANIRMQRMLQGIDRLALAKAIDVSPGQVAQIEHGSHRCSPARLLAIAKVLGVTIEGLMDGRFLGRDPSDLLPDGVDDEGLERRLLAAFAGLTEAQRRHLVTMAEAFTRPT